MNINDNNKYTIIDKYLKGGMSPNELDSFRAFLQSDKDFAEDLNIISEFDEAATFNLKEQQLRNTLTAIHGNRTVSTDTSAADSNTSYGKVLGGLVLLSAILFMLWKFVMPMSSNDANQAYPQYAMLDKLELTTKGSEIQVDVTTLQSLYNDKNYAKALPLIDNFLEQNPRDLDVLIAKGISHAELGQYQQAHSVFAGVKELGPRVNKYLWYDALTYAKEGQVAKAKVLLMEIIDTKSFNYTQAATLLETLD